MRLRYGLLGGVVLIVAAIIVLRRERPAVVPDPFPVLEPSAPVGAAAASEKATFGSGCFWCTEAVFQRLKGVKSAVSGYSGGLVPNPSYEQVCTGATGHAEVVQVIFDPAVVSYAQLLEIFWRTHDPTTPNRQGHDFGPQYRSVIFFHSDEQRRIAEEYKQKIDAATVFDASVVTQIVPFEVFYRAEAYHQNYYAENGRQPYCQAVIRPKMEALEKVFQDKLR